MNIFLALLALHGTAARATLPETSVTILKHEAFGCPERNVLESLNQEKIVNPVSFRVRRKMLTLLHTCEKLHFGDRGTVLRNEPGMSVIQFRPEAPGSPLLWTNRSFTSQP